MQVAAKLYRRTYFLECLPPCPQSNSNQYHTPIKRLQPASHWCKLQPNFIDARTSSNAYEVLGNIFDRFCVGKRKYSNRDTFRSITTQARKRMTKVGGRISIVLRKLLIIKQLLITNNPIVYSRHIKLKEKKSLKKLKNVYFYKINGLLLYHI